MNWFRQNRFLGAFLTIVSVATLGALYFLWSAKSGFNEARARFAESAAELNRLQRLAPFPNEANLRKMNTQAEDYARELGKVKEQLGTRVLPVVPMAPNEFQARLRQAMASVGDKARANRVKLPENFNLGFDEFAAGLPDTAAAPLLGQQLAQVELLLNILIDARVEAVISLRRVPAAQSTTSAGPKLIERSVIDAAFLSTPGAARRVFNQISTADQQFYILRTLHILNEKEKGPPRAAGAAGAATTSPTGQPPNAALNFIVGNERVQTSARIEMVRFTF